MTQRRQVLPWRRGLKVRALRRDLAQFCSCGLQHTGWPCNSCFHATRPASETCDDWHAIWHAVLAFRGDYDDQFNPETQTYRMAVDLVFKPDGNFSHHVFVDVPVAVLRAGMERLQAILQAHGLPGGTR